MTTRVWKERGYLRGLIMWVLTTAVLTGAQCDQNDDDSVSSSPDPEVSLTPIPSSAPDSSVTPGEPSVTPGEPSVTPGEHSATPSGPTVTPSGPIVTPGEPTVTPGEPTVTPGEPTATPDSSVTPESSPTPKVPDCSETSPVPEGIPVTFVVDFNAGRLDDNCETIEFTWIAEDPGDSMWIAGGVHKESPVADPDGSYSGQLGNWTPNAVAMYDDGCHGDSVAGDNVWSRTMWFPEGMRLGYKFTWGAYDEGWTGAEEWPGNQRLLEVVDVSGDGEVIRVDEFGDETTNKDNANCNEVFGDCKGTITWDTDLNGDGVPDARERKVDINNDCTLDLWPEEADDSYPGPSPTPTPTPMPTPTPTPEPSPISVVFMANFNEGQLDDNCEVINRKWIENDPGESMWIVGSIHNESPVDDPEGSYAAQLGNWSPNTVAMYDDGTHGDSVAGDGIWSLELWFLPGMRLGYKYTWGSYGQSWTGTEEFPGNQRLLELVDVSGDGRIIRVDEFGDETTNKDKANCNEVFGGCKGAITWDTDLNGDGLPDARERKMDVNNDCTLDLWPEEEFGL